MATSPLWSYHTGPDDLFRVIDALAQEVYVTCP